MNKLDEATKYFKENDGYIRLFKGMRKKYISLENTIGNVVINNPTDNEKQALSGLMKKDYSKSSSISINLRKMQQRLNESKFEGIELTALLKNYFKGDILTKKENIRNYENELELFWENILNENKNTYIYEYLKQSINKKDKLYENIKKYYNKNKIELEKDLLNACKGINNLPKIEKIRIPVFANTILSNPHGFDKKMVCGRLFILLLCYINKLPYPQNSEELSEIYYNNNLLADDVSSVVLCKNIMACAKGDVHKGLEGFNAYNEPVFLTLYNLSNISSVLKNEKYNKVVITENPAVFMGIIAKCKYKDFPLICTYGQVKLAGIMLMDLLVEQRYKLYYSGDLDPEGIQIACRLKQRYKDSLDLLGFNMETYYKNMSNVELSGNRLQKLNNVECTELVELCNALQENKKPAYEEENINNIVQLIETTFTN